MQRQHSVFSQAIVVIGRSVSRVVVSHLHYQFTLAAGWHSNGSSEWMVLICVASVHITVDRLSSTIQH